MRAHSCPSCGQLVFFDDTVCVACGTSLAYRPSDRSVGAVGPEDRRCGHHDEIGCGWLVEDPGGDGDDLCRSCRLTRTRPPAQDAEAVATWAEAEHAKRMLLDQSFTLGIDLEGAAFDLKSGRLGPVTTGHEDGVITIDVHEADDVTRTRMREEMGEAYRTVLGHFRHEIGHYLWMTLVDGTDNLDGFREIFGDDREDYAAALEAHYGSAPPAGWQDLYVSAYATAHPWEDFAETVAHYLHIRDTLETAGSFGVTVDGAHPVLEAQPAEAEGEPIRGIIAEWLPLTYALNAVNRSMGAPDLYPFVLAQPVVNKLGWVHRLLEGAESSVSARDA